MADAHEGGAREGGSFVLASPTAIQYDPIRSDARHDTTLQSNPTQPSTTQPNPVQINAHRPGCVWSKWTSPPWSWLVRLGRRADEAMLAIASSSVRDLPDGVVTEWYSIGQ